MGDEFRAVPGEDLFKACSVLFGPEVNVTAGFLSYVQVPGIKSAYRRVARLTHPDHAVGMGDQERERNVRRFIEAKRAHDLLVSFITNRDAVIKSHGFHRARAAAEGAPVRKAEEQPRGDSRRCRGNVPTGRLRFGQFLYYSGRISYADLVSAIVWQRQRRVRIGEVAKRKGWLSDAQVQRVLSLRTRGELFGEMVVRLGLISREQLVSLLAAQRLAQSPIGQYFVQNRHLSFSEINSLHREFLVHNARSSGPQRWDTACGRR